MSNPKKILVVVDMQGDFINGVLGSQDAQDIVPKVVQKIESAQQKNMPIICTMDMHDPDVYNLTDEGRKLPIHCVPEDASGWQLHPDVLNQLGERAQGTWKRITKHVYGSSYLANLLRRMHPDYVEFVGLCTDVCVISNAILTRSVLPRATIVVDASCCAGVTPEGHQAALHVMHSCGIDVVNEA